MSSDALMWAKRVRVGDSTRKAILLVLADYADEAGSCFPSQTTIGAQAEVSERSVRRVMAELEERGVLRREHRSGGHYGRTSDRIFLNLDWGGDSGAACVATPPPDDLQPDTLAGSDRSATASASGQTVTGNSNLQPDPQSTQPATGDHATGHSLAAEPPRTTKNQNRAGKRRRPLTRVAAPPADDDGGPVATLAATARLAAHRDLARYLADRKAGNRDADGQPLRPVTSVKAYLVGCAENFVLQFGPDAEAFLELDPSLTPQLLLDQVDAYGVKRNPQPVRVAELGCHQCDVGFIETGAGVERCPNCLPDLSARNLPRGANA